MTKCCSTVRALRFNVLTFFSKNAQGLSLLVLCRLCAFYSNVRTYVRICKGGQCKKFYQINFHFKHSIVTA